MNIPFTESDAGLPVWRLQVDDPAAAVEAKVELAYKALAFPQGGILALCLKVFDHPGRPALFHQAVAFGSLEQRALIQHQAIRLVFEHRGWNSDTRQTLALPWSVLPSLPEGQDALAPYLAAYRAHQSAGGPEAAWAAIERGLAAPAKAKAGWSAWLMVLVLFIGLALLWAAATWAGLIHFPSK